jgi:hypothetical protein
LPNIAPSDFISLQYLNKKHGNVMKPGLKTGNHFSILSNSDLENNPKQGPKPETYRIDPRKSNLQDFQN